MYSVAYERRMFKCLAIEVSFLLASTIQLDSPSFNGKFANIAVYDYQTHGLLVHVYLFCYGFVTVLISILTVLLFLKYTFISHTYMSLSFFPLLFSHHILSVVKYS